MIVGTREGTRYAHAALATMVILPVVGASDEGTDHPRDPVGLLHGAAALLVLLVCTMNRKCGLPFSCSVAPKDVGLDCGPIRAYSWEMLHDEQYYHRLPISVEFNELDPLGARLEMFAGEALLRDVRAAHARTPNRTDQDRVLPAFQIEGPWLRSNY